VDHPGAVFMDTGSNWFFFGKDDQNAPPAFWFGADNGRAAFYVIAGDSVASVTQRLQRLVGTTPAATVVVAGPPPKPLGLCRHAALAALDAAFTQHAFPNDGLWLDIDYMDASRCSPPVPSILAIWRMT
jgi:alpha-glucosidase